MVKELILARHGEAHPSGFDVKDKQRELTPRGEVISSKTGFLVKDKMGKPDLVISSSSVRTRQTSELIAEQLQFNPAEIEYSDDFYEASTRILLQKINSFDEKFKKVIVVAHNPGISFLAEYLTGEIIGNVDPAGAVHLKYNGNWDKISEKNADLVGYYPPAKDS